MADLLTFPNPDEDLAIEPDDEPGIEPEPELEIEPTPEPPAAASRQALAVLPLAELLPADFDLPALIKWVPNPALRIAADQAGTYALNLVVDGAEGLQRADLALQAVRASLRGITDAFADPVTRANALHKRLTGIRGEWCERGELAVKTVGGRMYTEQRRLEALAAEERRKAQAEADRQAREAAQAEVAAAEKAQAPAPVVQELRRQAETVTAPPVVTPTTAPVLRGSTTVATWKARLVGTPGSDDPNPTMDALSPAQRLRVFELMRAVLEGKAPLTAFELGWSYLNKRAKADRSTLALAGIEAFEEGSIRAKGTRTK